MLDRCIMTDTGQQFLPLQKHFSLKQQVAGRTNSLKEEQ